MTKNRNGNVELLRFIFANLVVLHHAILPVFYGGWLGVEFFFIISGLYMAQGLEKKKNDAATEDIIITVKASRDYIWKRFSSIFPFLVLSTIIGFIVQVLDYSFGSTIKDQLKLVVRLPYEFACLQNYGFPSISCIGTVWYLSAMFFAIWLLYPIVRRKYDLYVGYIAPGATLLLSGELIRNYGMLGSACEWTPLGFNSGFLRAISGISWGTFLYTISKRIREKQYSKFQKIALTIIELLSYIIVFAYMYKWKLEDGINDPVFVLIMSIGVVITTSGQSILHGMFNKRWVYFAGKLSVVLFMNHAYWLYHIVSLDARYFGGGHSEVKLKLLGIILSYISTFLVYFAGVYLKRTFVQITSREKVV